ncbi:MAG TPA: restriction endonuclease [Chloroflexia bacterium]|jgi:5-methylcytosine-specific restriction protein A
MLDDKHPHVIELSRKLNLLSGSVQHPDVERFRNPNGVAMKLANFASIDPNHAGKALDNVARGDKEVWEEFANNREGLAREVASIQAQLHAGALLPDEAK